MTIAGHMDNSDHPTGQLSTILGVVREADHGAAGAASSDDGRPTGQPGGMGLSSGSLRYANLEMHPAEYQVLVDAKRLALTIREFEVLFALAERLDRVVNRGQIYEIVWGGKMKHRERAVDVFVRKVRIKLSEAAPDWLYIHTHFGIGYRFAPEQRHDQA